MLAACVLSVLIPVCSQQPTCSPRVLTPPPRLPSAPRDCKQIHAAPVWLRGAAAALAGGGSRNYEEPESLEGADTIEDFYEVGGTGGTWGWLGGRQL